MLTPEDEKRIPKLLDTKHFRPYAAISKLQALDESDLVTVEMYLKMLRSAAYSDIPSISKFADPSQFPNMPVSDFIRRLPYFFYVPPSDEKYPTTIANYADNFTSWGEKPDGLTIEDFYNSLDIMYYRFGISVHEIIAYESAQHHPWFRSEFFFKWAHYLDLRSSLEDSERLPIMPEQFALSYNELLESTGNAPIIYPVYEPYDCSTFYEREGDRLYFTSSVPHKDGQPVWRWLGLKMQNVSKVYWGKIPYGSERIVVEMTPSTVIYFLDPYSQEWRQLFVGP